MARLREQYRTEVRKKLQDTYNYSNEMMIPRLEKIVINMGVGEAAADKKKLQAAIADMQAITGQKPVATKARKSIAGFKIRDNMNIGCKVTLRGERMYEFLDRLTTVAMPRIRDFRGVSPKGFDGHGNYTMGLKEQLIFMEIDYDSIDQIRGMNISFVTTAKNDAEAQTLLEAFSVPFAAEQGGKHG